MDRRKKRFWSDDEKREICQQTAVSGVSVAQVARRYAVNANLIFKWLKDVRFSPAPENGPDDGVPEPAMFLPVEIDGTNADEGALEAASPLKHVSVTARRIDITLSDGRRILVEGSMDLMSVIGLVKGLAG